MKRDIAGLEGQHFDVAVIGGGVMGAALSYELGLRSMRCIVIDRADFASGTSQNNQRILHGGFRYLQNGNVPRVLDSIAAVNRWHRLFPNWVIGLEARIPVANKGLQRPSVLWAAAKGYDLLARLARADSWWRPSGVRGSDDAKLCPSMALANSAELYFHDALMLAPERAVLELIRFGVSRGGAAANYCELTHFAEGALHLYDTIDSVRASISAKRTIFCTGPAAILIEGVPPQIARGHDYLTGSHISVDGFKTLGGTIGIPHEKGMLFANRIGNKVLFGSDWQRGDVSDEQQVNRLCRWGSEAVPSEASSFREIGVQHQGIVPCDEEGELLEKPVQYQEGMVHRIIANKYTTALSVARHWANRHIGALPRGIAESSLVNHTIFELSLRDAPYEFSAEQLRQRYGSGLEAMAQNFQSRYPESSSWRDWWRFEQNWARLHDMAQTDEDILRRRTGISALQSLPSYLKS